jgi:hypothetical protein
MLIVNCYNNRPRKCAPEATGSPKIRVRELCYRRLKERFKQTDLKRPRLQPVLKVCWTIIDLAGTEEIQPSHNPELVNKRFNLFRAPFSLARTARSLTSVPVNKSIRMPGTSNNFVYSGKIR